MFTYKHFSANGLVMDPFPFRRELAMEAYIYENQKILTLNNDDFGEAEILDIEMTVKHLRTKGDGRLDIFASYGDDYLAVVELKAGVLNSSHVRQIGEYLENKKEIEEAIGKEIETKDKGWIGVLVGTGIEPGLAVEIVNGKRTESGIPLVAIVLTRFRSEDGQVYVISDIYNAVKKSDKDRKKYEFEGNTYGKGRLVLAVIKSHIRNNSEITYAELRQAFPEALQRNYGVFQLLDSDKVKNSRIKGYKRYYFEPDEIVELADKTKIVVSSQWGSGNWEWHGKVGGFVEHCIKMGMQIKPVPGT